MMNFRIEHIESGLSFLGLLLSKTGIEKWLCFNMLKYVRYNPDAAPRLTSGGYEDKVDVITPIKILVDEGVCPAFTRLVSSVCHMQSVHDRK
jgi:hypothetical protein